MSVPHSYENSLRIHDKAFYDWLGGLRVDYDGSAGIHPEFPEAASYPVRKGFPILRTMATRMRAFATIVDLLVAQNWITGNTASELRQKASDFSVLPLPIATFERGDPTPDLQSVSVPKRFRRSRFNQETGQWENHPWPGIYLLPYTVTFWCIKRYTEAYVREWLMSQIGRLGVNDSEVLIPVEHSAPWGTQFQALRLEGTADQSDLEGENPRYIRFEASFVLRFLHMRPFVEEGDYLNAVQTPIHFPRVEDGVTTDAFSRTADIECVPTRSFNLFEPFYTSDSDIASKWPRAGNATVARSKIAPVGVSPLDVLRADVRTVTDRVGIVEKPVLIPEAPNDRAILSVAMRYRSTAEVSLAMHQKPGTNSPSVWTPIREVTLAASNDWRDIQFFTLADQHIVSLVVQGRAIDADFWFTEVDFRHVFNVTPTLPTTSTTGFGGGTKHIWSGLQRPQSYLVVAIPDSPTGSWEMRTQDDDASPTATAIRTFDATAEKGFVEIMQPAGSTLALTVPAGFPSATFYIQPYIGGFRGRIAS